MADYKKFFKRENFIASMQAAKERKQKAIGNIAIVAI